jgi:predicted acetyltransferase
VDEAAPPYPIRPVSLEEFDRFLPAADAAFGDRSKKEKVEAERSVFEPDRSLAAFDRDDVVGTASAFTLELTVPGAGVGAAGVTFVAVRPSHRRRGILTSLMRRQLRDVRDRDEPVAILWASESPIYWRFGYGVAALGASFTIDRKHAALLPDVRPPSGRLRYLELGDAVSQFPLVYDAVRPTRPGFVDRPGERWWRYRVEDIEEHREGFGPLFFVLHGDEDGEPDGYVIYTFKHDWSHGASHGIVRVEELVAATDDAAGDLWRFALDLDLSAVIDAWNRPVDDPLFHMVRDPRRLRMEIQETLWARLVDVASALGARRYGTEGGVVLDVRDAFCPWNEGRYELAAGPEGAECRATSREADVSLSAADLGAVYLGGIRFAVLARAGRVREERPGALARADAMFGWDPLPWCPHAF